MARKARRKKKEITEPKPKIKEKVADMLELPKEVVLNIPKFIMLGMGNLIIENYKGIVEYDDNRIRINTGSGMVKISGERLFIREITSEDIMVEGEIKSLEFIR